MALFGVELGLVGLGVTRGKEDSSLVGVGVAFGVRVWVAIPFALKEDGKIWGCNSTTREAGSEFLFLLRWFGLDNRAGGGGT